MKKLRLAERIPVFMRNPRLRLLAIYIILLSLVGAGVAFCYNWVLGVVLLVLLILGSIFISDTFHRVNEETTKYISDLSFRIKRSEQDSLLRMPLGILIYGDEDQVQWVNPYMQGYLSDKDVLGKKLVDVDKDLAKMLADHRDEKGTVPVVWGDRRFTLLVEQDSHVLYLMDITKYAKIEEAYDNSQVVIGQVFLDNYDEVTQSMADSDVSSLSSFVTNQISSWAQEFGMYLKRVDDDHFFVLMYAEVLQKVEADNFKLLDTIREATSKQNFPITLSIGIAYGDQDLNNLADLSQSNLDLALGRGGDQVVVKSPDGQARFYGGKTNPMEKRTRVRARMISQAVTELMSQADQIFVMGHQQSDMDSLGACLGIRRIAQMNNRQCWIVLDQDNLHSDVRRLLTSLEDYPSIKESIITPEAALENANSQSLLIMVDHSKPSLTTAPELYKKLENRVMIIDHHRRGTEFPENPVLVYIEPYASSTCELITEMFEYQSKDSEPINEIEATGMLAGIEIDTKSFTTKTGTRTFDAASYLRSVGADENLIRHFMKENVDSYLQRNHLIESVEFINKNLAVCVGEDDRDYDPVTAAQAADSLLSISGIEASFVITRRSKKQVGISARSAGDVNVQLIMEQMGGGGHLGSAATQIEGQSVSEVKATLTEILEKKNDTENEDDEKE